jgi:hypothetical protein
MHYSSLLDDVITRFKCYRLACSDGSAPNYVGRRADSGSLAAMRRYVQHTK